MLHMVERKDIYFFLTLLVYTFRDEACGRIPRSYIHPDGGDEVVCAVVVEELVEQAGLAHAGVPHHHCK